MTKDNPSLGCKNLAKHHIILKQNFKPLHQRSYRLPPTKREVLRHHLDELLQQGVICKLDANEEAPITSPIVLIEKRMKSSEPKANDRDSSLREYRFCVDYQYINSQSETFIYNIQNLLELNESFTEREPNFIASIDLSTGFFQMKMSPIVRNIQPLIHASARLNFFVYRCDFIHLPACSWTKSCVALLSNLVVVI